MPMLATCNVNDPQFYMLLTTITVNEYNDNIQMHLRQKQCMYAHKHKAKDPSFNNNQYKKLYHQPKCKLYFCAFCLKQLLIQKQKLQQQEKSLTLKLPCWCKVKDKQIYQFLAIKCKECTKLVTALSSAVPIQGGYIHARCHRLSVYNNKISTDVPSIRNKASSVRSVSFVTHAIEVQSCNLLGKLQIIINKPTFQLDCHYESEREKTQQRPQQKSEVNEYFNRQNADQQFYPVQQWKSSLKIENDLYIECYYCKYPLPRGKLYEVHIILQVQPVNDQLFCIRCLLYASGKLKTASQLKQASKQQLKAKQQQTIKKHFQSNQNPKAISRITPKQHKLIITRPLTRSHAPIHSLLRQRQKMNIISDKLPSEFNRKQMLKRLSPFDVDLN